MAVVRKQDDDAVRRFCLMQQRRQYLNLVVGPTGIDLFALRERVVDRVHDDTDDPAMRCSDRVTDFGGHAGLVYLLERRFVEQDGRGPAAAMRPEPGMLGKALFLHRGIALPQLPAQETRARDLRDRGQSSQARSVRRTSLLTESQPILPGQIAN